MAPEFSDRFRSELETLLKWRRDVRRFQAEPIPDVARAAILSACDAAPSVGLSQPWRLIDVRSGRARSAVAENFKVANAVALATAHSDRADDYVKLKLAGIETAPFQLAVFCDPAPEAGDGLGRQTMPEMVHASAVCAVMQMWLVARAWGVGLGWVSILNPDHLKRDLDVPTEWDLVAYLCLGYPADPSDQPELERLGWEQRSPASGSIQHR